MNKTFFDQVTQSLYAALLRAYQRCKKTIQISQLYKIYCKVRSQVIQKARKRKDHYKRKFKVCFVPKHEAVLRAWAEFNSHHNNCAYIDKEFSYIGFKNAAGPENYY